MTEQDKFDYVPIVKIENKLYAEGLTSIGKVSIIVNECLQHPCYRGFWIRDDRGPEWYHNVCVCRVAQFLAMGKKIEARFEFPQLEKRFQFPQLENKEQKPSEILQLLKDIEINYDIMIAFAQQKAIPEIDALKKDKELVTIAIAKLMTADTQESKSDSRKLPEFWYKFVNTGLTFRGHLIFLGPSVGNKQADKRTLTQLDKFIKSNMPLIYEIIRDETTGTAVEGALNK